MIASLRHFLGWMVSTWHSLRDLVLENLALRRHCWLCTRTRLTALHKLFWVAYAKIQCRFSLQCNIVTLSWNPEESWAK